MDDRWSLARRCRLAPHSLARVLDLPATAVGVALLIAQAIARWIPYVVYRNSGVRWQTPDRLHRLILLSIVFMAMLPTVDVATLSPWPIALVFGWCVLQARHEVLLAWRGVYRLKPRQSSEATDVVGKAPSD